MTPTTARSVVRNFGEDYQDVSGQLGDMLYPGRYLFAYGIYYPEHGGHRFEVKQIVFPGRPGREYVFEDADWWVNQVRAVADFYLRGQFPDGNYDWRNYRTKLTLAGTHTPDYVAPDFRQETDTISRLVYGLATAYLLTGQDRFLEAAERGTEYLRENVRGVREDEGVVFWFHGIDISSNGQRKILASEFGDDLDAIPDVRADLRPRRPDPDVPDNRRPAHPRRHRQDRRAVRALLSRPRSGAATSPISNRYRSTLARPSSGTTAPERTGIRSATTRPRT